MFFNLPVVIDFVAPRGACPDHYLNRPWTIHRIDLDMLQSTQGTTKIPKRRSGLFIVATTEAEG